MDFVAIYRYRDLLLLLVRRDFVARYQQTILGPAWFVIQPLVTTLAFTAVFGNVLGAPTDGIPSFQFYLCGMLGWSYFSNLFTATGNSFGANAGLFTKVYFPRLILPLSAVFSNLLAFAVQAATFLAFYLPYIARQPASGGLHPNYVAIALVPALLLQSAALGLGSGLATSALSAKYRDLQMIVPFAVQILMFATPVIYPLSKLGPRVRWMAELNPMTAVVEGFRVGFFGVGTITVPGVVLSVAMTAVVLFGGIVLFQRSERTFADLA